MKHIYDDPRQYKTIVEEIHCKLTEDKETMEIKRKKAEEFIAALEEELLRLEARYDETDYICHCGSEDEIDALTEAIHSVKKSLHERVRDSWQGPLMRLDKNALTNLIARLDLNINDPDCYQYIGLTADEWLDYYGHDGEDDDPEEMLYWASVEADEDRDKYQAEWDDVREDDIYTLKRLRELQASLIEE